MKKKISAWAVIQFCAPFSWKKIDLTERIIMVNSVLMLVAYSLLSMLSTIILKDIVNLMVLGDVAYYYVAAYCMSYFFAEVANNLKMFSFVYVEAKIQTKLSEMVFHHVLNLSMAYHLTRETGKVLRMIQRGSISVPQVIRTGLFYVFPIFLQLILVELYLVFTYDLLYALAIGVSVISYVLFTVVASEWRSKIQRNLNVSDSSFHSKATDALFNYETVKYNNAEDHETARCSSAFHEFRLSKVKMHKSLLVLHIGQEFLVLLGTAFCLIYVAFQILNSEKGIGDLILIQGFLSLIYAPLKNMGNYYESIKQAVIDSEGILLLMAQTSEIQDKANAIVLQECKGELLFEDVSFMYSSSLSPVVQHLNFIVQSGQTIGIVGATGSGKSTICKLIFRLYEATEGSIKVDGIDIRDLTQQSLRKSIGVVPQDCCLFNDTIAYNIGYAHSTSFEEIQWAANKAHIHELIESLPLKYQTIIGEKGLRLSGGERQRLAIARALLKSPKILCFDEATSALDTITEEMIQESIKELTKNTTSLIIAHRLKSVVHSHCIIVLDSGKIIEKGTHEKLLENNGKYYELWTQQGEVSKISH